MKKLFITLVLLCSTCFAQSWSGVLASSRAIDWGASGYGAGLRQPSLRRTTSNPWTPPTRTQCGSTLSPIGGGSDDSRPYYSTLACTAGHYLFSLGRVHSRSTAPSVISPGYNSGVTNYISLRGSGPMSTKISYLGLQARSTFGAGSGGSVCTLTSGFELCPREYGSDLFRHSTLRRVSRSNPAMRHRDERVRLHDWL